MSLKGKTIGLAVTGSFCTFDKIKQTVQTLIQEEAELYPIFSSHVQTTRSRFGSTDEYIRTISGLAGREPILTIEDAEPIGPKGYLDLLLIAPCTGNTLAKLANGITDTPVLMAAKAHLRNEKPLVIFLSTNDAMGMNFKNIGLLFPCRHVYFVPFSQDSPQKKPCSLVARTELVIPTIKAALKGEQLQPVLYGPD